ncbi:MAG: PP2C family protein-serine/threonine phosphatase [Gallionella sp.]|jgi:hypothetical protein
MKVRTKIIIGFSAPILMFFAFGLWLHFVLKDASDYLMHVKNESVAYALIAKDMETDVIQVQQFLSDISATRARDGLDDGFKNARTHYERFNADLAKFEQLFAATGNLDGMKSCRLIRVNFNALYSNGVRMAHAFIDGGPHAGNRLMLNLDKTSLTLKDSLQPFIKTQLDDMDAAVEKAESNADKARIVGLILGLLVINISFFVARATLHAFNLYIAQRKQAELSMQLAQRELKEKNMILSDEKELLEDIVAKMRSASPFNGLKVRHIQSSLEKTAGDIVLSAYRPDGTQHVLVGDFSGHGLPAAVGGPLVSYVFYRLTADGFDMRYILEEVNRILCRKLPPQLYMAADALQLSADRKQAAIWNCGMPPVLCLSNGMKRIESSGLPLGLSESIDSFEPHAQVDIKPDMHIYMYSDGLTEAMSIENEQYGQSRLESLVSRIQKAGLPLEVIWPELEAFCGAQGLSDDAVMVEISP